MAGGFDYKRAASVVKEHTDSSMEQSRVQKYTHIYIVNLSFTKEQRQNMEEK